MGDSTPNRAGPPESSRRVRVLHVTNRLGDHGGAEVSLLQTLPLLQVGGIESAVQPLLTSRPDVSVEPLTAAGVVLFAPPAGTTMPARLRAVRRAIRQFQPDIVHSSVWDADLIARLATPRARDRCVVSLINTMYSVEARGAAPSPRKLEAHRRIDALLVRRTLAFHALTQATADSAQATIGVPADRVTVVPRGRSRSVLGEPSEDRKARVRAALGLAPDAEIILNVARQERQKGMRDLVQAFAAVARSQPRAVLLQAGRPGAATADLEAGIAQAALGDRVRLLGRRGDVGDLMTAADVFLLTSHWEGLGGVVLEAMALELPVVAYDVPAVREVLAGTGVIVPAGDTEQLSSAVRGVLEDRVASTERAKAARTRFDVEFELDGVTRRMASMYRTLAAQAAQPGDRMS